MTSAAISRLIYDRQVLCCHLMEVMMLMNWPLLQRGLFVEELNSTPSRLRNRSVRLSCIRPYLALSDEVQSPYGGGLWLDWWGRDGKVMCPSWLPLVRLSYHRFIPPIIEHSFPCGVYEREPYLTNLGMSPSRKINDSSVDWHVFAIVKWMKKKYKVTNGKLKVVRREIIAKAAEVNMTLSE